MWSFIVDFAAPIGTIIAAVSLMFGAITHLCSVLRARKQNTIEAFARLQEEVLDKLSSFSKTEASVASENWRETREERQIYHDYKVLLSRLEHFAVGINEGTYDFKTFWKLGGVHVCHLYERMEPIVLEARNNATDGSVPFAEFEHLYRKLKKKLDKKKASAV